MNIFSVVDQESHGDENFKWLLQNKQNKGGTRRMKEVTLDRIEYVYKTYHVMITDFT